MNTTRALRRWQRTGKTDDLRAWISGCERLDEARALREDALRVELARAEACRQEVARDYLRGCAGVSELVQAELMAIRLRRRAGQANPYVPG